MATRKESVPETGDTDIRDSKSIELKETGPAPADPGWPTDQPDHSDLTPAHRPTPRQDMDGKPAPLSEGLRAQIEVSGEGVEAATGKMVVLDKSGNPVYKK